MKNELVFELLCVAAFVLAYSIKKIGAKIKSRYADDGRKASARIRGLHSEGEPSGPRAYREHSARVDKASFIGSREMYDFVSGLTKSQGLEYPFNYARDIRHT